MRWIQRFFIEIFPASWAASMEVSVNFLEERLLSDLTKIVNLKKLKFETTFSVPGERHYTDLKNGIGYGVQMSYGSWFSLKYFPSAAYKNVRCPD